MPKNTKDRTDPEARAAFPARSLISLISFDCFSNAEPGHAS